MNISLLIKFQFFFIIYKMILIRLRLVVGGIVLGGNPDSDQKFSNYGIAGERLPV